MPPNTTPNGTVQDKDNEQIPEKEMMLQKIESFTVMSDDDVKHYRKSYKSSISQVIATSVQSLLLLALGMMLGYPTIVIGDLKIETTAHKPTVNITCGNMTMSSTQQISHGTKYGGPTMTDGDSSLLVGTLLLMQPIGSVLSGFIQEKLGRKRCMMLVNVPQIAGWLLSYFATNVTMLVVAAALLGFAVGFMEGPTLSYVGEISQPHLRGRLASCTSLYVSGGFVVIFLLGSLFGYQMSAAYSLIVPICTCIALLQIPESPIWLLLQNRDEDALRALCWLRGWTRPQKIRNEFNELKKHAEASKLAKEQPGVLLPDKDGVLRAPKAPLCMKLQDLVRPAMLRPLFLVVSFKFFLHCASLSSIKPYFLEVIHYVLPTSECDTGLIATVQKGYLPVVSAVFQILGSIFCILLVTRVGKRNLSLISMFLCSLITAALGAYTFLLTYSSVSEPVIPMVLFPALFFFTNFGIGVIPWTLLAEVFPSRGRGVGAGVSAASYYVWFFFVTVLYPPLKMYIGLHGLFFFFAALGFIGLVFIYFQLPETEGKSLSEIEQFFKSKPKSCNPV